MRRASSGFTFAARRRDRARRNNRAQENRDADAPGSTGRSPSLEIKPSSSRVEASAHAIPTRMPIRRALSLRLPQPASIRRCRSRRAPCSSDFAGSPADRVGQRARPAIQPLRAPGPGPRRRPVATLRISARRPIRRSLRSWFSKILHGLIGGQAHEPFAKSPSPFRRTLAPDRTTTVNSRKRMAGT